jgi:adducin
MFLRNHGVVACGETIEEACFNLFNVLAACEIQAKALIGGLDNIIIPSSEVQKSISDMASTQNETLTVNENKKWKIGELEFEALMRCLDNAGYRTGYMYRQPIMRTIDRNAVKEIEIPPAAQSHSYDIEYVRKLKEEKSKVIKGEWLNSPNNYARTEIEETGTPNPKKITKWIPESSPSKTSTPIRIENKNQFAPQGMDPKELKNNIKQIKQDRFDDKKGPGYTSKILIGIPGDENGLSQHQVSPGSAGGAHQQAAPGEYSQTGNNTSIVYGAASKGIIKRDQQNNAGVYKTYYNAANPFQQMDSGDLEKYKKEVAQKQIREQGGMDDRANKSEITVGESKKKSHTIPRSKSMLDKKHEKVSDQIKSNSGVSDQSSSEESMLDKSKQSNSANNSTPLVAINMNTPGGQGSVSLTQQNKSATMGAHTSTSSEKSKADKPKKKSKLSFLSRKKKEQV